MDNNYEGYGDDDGDEPSSQSQESSKESSEEVERRRKAINSDTFIDLVLAGRKKNRTITVPPLFDQRHRPKRFMLSEEDFHHLLGESDGSLFGGGCRPELELLAVLPGRSRGVEESEPVYLLYDAPKELFLYSAGVECRLLQMMRAALFHAHSPANPSNSHGESQSPEPGHSPDPRHSPDPSQSADPRYSNSNNNSPGHSPRSTSSSVPSPRPEGVPSRKMKESDCVAALQVNSWTSLMHHEVQHLGDMQRMRSWRRFVRTFLWPIFRDERLVRQREEAMQRYEEALVVARLRANEYSDTDSSISQLHSIVTKDTSSEVLGSAR